MEYNKFMQKTESQTHEPESVGSIMSTNIPTCRPQTILGQILKYVSAKSWDSIRNVYVTDNSNKLLGFIDMAAVIQSNPETVAKDFMQPAKVFLKPGEDQEKAVFIAVKDDLIGIPVVDEDGQFLGAVTAHKIIDVMHQEHVEDALLTAGIRGKSSHIVRLASERTGLVVKSRAPWLIVGLLFGLGLGLISSWFEESLQKTVAIAYFIPVVAYIADSVGTQSEAIAIRALATLNLNYRRYLLRELLVGFIIGSLMGILGGLGAVLISKSMEIGLVVGLSLLVASTIASALASLLPIIFKLLGKDPALGSGPLATALQDVTSVVIYFLFATTFIR